MIFCILFVYFAFGYPLILDIGASQGPPGGLGGLKLDEIDATNSFLMLLMARYSLKWPFKSRLRPYKKSYTNLF